MELLDNITISLKADKVEQLAAEGHRFCAAEALEFAEMSAGAVLAALKPGSTWRLPEAHGTW